VGDILPRRSSRLERFETTRPGRRIEFVSADLDHSQEHRKREQERKDGHDEGKRK
jgi:hypothetical protein